jgi:hypothetical protein
MKKLALSLAALAAFGAQAFAATPIGDTGATLSLTATAGVRYDDNLLQAETGTLNDTIFTFAPGLEVQFDKTGATLLSFKEELNRYADTSGLDSNLATVSLRSNMTRGADTGKFNASYTQSDQNTPVSGVPGLLRRNIVSVGGSGEWEIVPVKQKFGLGVSYDDTDYNQNTLADSKIYTVPLNYYYEINPKLFLSPGFTYRKTNLKTPLTGAKTDYTDYKYSIGLRQDALTNVKLTGNFNIGLNHRTPDVGKSESSFNLDSTLNYAADPKTSYNLTLSNDFGQSSVGTSQKTFRVGGGVNRSFDAQWSGSANASYSQTDYAGTRKDNYWDANLVLSWSGLSKYYDLTLELSYGYKNNSSNAALSSYTGNVIGLTAKARY